MESRQCDTSNCETCIKSGCTAGLSFDGKFNCFYNENAADFVRIFKASDSCLFASQEPSFSSSVSAFTNVVTSSTTASATFSIKVDYVSAKSNATSSSVVWIVSGLAPLLLLVLIIGFWWFFYRRNHEVEVENPPIEMNEMRPLPPPPPLVLPPLPPRPIPAEAAPSTSRQQNPLLDNQRSPPPKRVRKQTRFLNMKKLGGEN